MSSRDAKIDLFTNSAWAQAERKKFLSNFNADIQTTQNSGVRCDEGKLDLYNIPPPIQLELTNVNQNIEKEMDTDTDCGPMDSVELNTMTMDQNSLDAYSDSAAVKEDTPAGNVLNTSYKFDNIQTMIPADLEIKFLGVKWKFDTVTKVYNDMPIELNGLIPFNDNGQRIFLQFNGIPVQPFLGSNISQREESGDRIMQNETRKICSDGNFNGESYLGDMEGKLLADTNFGDENAFLNVAEVTGVPDDHTVVNNGDAIAVENVEKITTVEPGNDNQGHDDEKEKKIPKMKKNESKSVSYDVTFKPRVFVNEQFAEEPQRDVEMALKAKDAYSPKMIEGDIPVPKVPIVSDASSDIMRSSNKFICQFCGSGYSQLNRWKTHVKIHTGLKVYKCTCEKCGIPYRDLRTVKKLHYYGYQQL